MIIQRKCCYLARVTLLLCVLATVPRETFGQARQVSTYPIEEFMETVRITTAPSFSPDGEKLLFTSDASGVPNAYVVPFDGGEPQPLTQSIEAIRTHGYFPSDERFLYSSDQGGNELSHIFVRNLDGTVRDLTPGDNLRALFLGWAVDDRSFYFAANERDPRRMDVYEMSLDTYERTLLFRNEEGVRVGGISPDRRLLAIVRPNSRHDTDLSLYDRSAGVETPLSPAEGEVRQIPEGFGPDSRYLYYRTDRGSEFMYLNRYDIVSGEHETVFQPDWDVQSVSFSPKRRYLIAEVNHDARTEIHVLETATLEPLPLPSIPAGDITSVVFSRDERRLAFRVSSGRSPGDLYVLDLEGGEPRALVRTLNPAIAPAHLVEPEVVRFASYDGLEIPGLLYRPHAATPDSPVPAMIWIHGGPGGQSRVGYDPLIQYLVNHGYAVYAINNRGSSGYGRSFEAMDDRRHGEVDLGDVVASKEMLIDTGWIDPGRIGVMGASYGGYLTMAALTFRPEEFAVGVNIYGVMNWVRTLEEGLDRRPWMESGRAITFNELGHPATDKERLTRISPLFHAEQITKPFIVLQGANDPRVAQIESDEIVAEARSNGVPVEYVVFDDEGHGFRKKENQIRAYSAILDFLDRYLKGNSE